MEMTSRRTIEPLTPRQREVLALLAEGRTNPEIAQLLGISLDGVKWHVREVLARLDVSSREEAGAYWKREQSWWRRAAWVAPLFASAHARLVVAAAAAIGLGAVGVALHAARDRDSDIPLAQATGTAAPTATATPAAVDEFAPHSGIPVVDEVIAIVKSGDVAAFRAFMKAFPEPCTTKQRGVGSPPACPQGAPEGSMVDTLRASAGERVDMGADMDQFLANVVPHLSTLHGVAVAQHDTFRGLFPAWKYEVIAYGNFGGQQVWGFYLLDDTGVVGVWVPGGGFAASDRARSIPDADWLVAPIGVPLFAGIPGLFVLGRDPEIRFPVKLPPACAGRPFGIKLYGYPPPGVSGGIQELSEPGLDVVARAVADPSGFTNVAFPLPGTASAPLIVRPGLLASCLSGIAVQGQTSLALLASAPDREIAIIEYSGAALDLPGGLRGGTIGEFISPLTATVNGTICTVVDTADRTIRNSRGNVEFRIGTADQPAACRAPGARIVFKMPESTGPGLAGQPLFEKPAFIPGAIQLVRNIGPEGISN
jgi:DNA-binding CsgD family transcriptional regulator